MLLEMKHALEASHRQIGNIFHQQMIEYNRTHDSPAVVDVMAQSLNELAKIIEKDKRQTEPYYVKLTRERRRR